MKGDLFPITTTKQRYKIKDTDNVGVVIPFPCGDPLVLEFKCGKRYVCHLYEIEKTFAPITALTSMKGYGINYQGRPKGISKNTVKKMLIVYDYLFEQDKPVKRIEIEQAVGFNCIRSLSTSPSRNEEITLESLGIIERIVFKRSWLKWKLTPLGLKEGKLILEDIL